MVSVYLSIYSTDDIRDAVAPPQIYLESKFNYIKYLVHAYKTWIASIYLSVNDENKTEFTLWYIHHSIHIFYSYVHIVANHLYTIVNISSEEDFLLFLIHSTKQLLIL